MLDAPATTSTAINELTVSSRELAVPQVSLRDQIVCAVISNMLSSISGNLTSESKFDKQIKTVSPVIRNAIRVGLAVGDMYDEIRGELNDVQPQSRVEASEEQSEEGLEE